MTQPEKKTSPKKMILFASLGLLIPIFLVSMAYLAVNSDQKNQEKYKQQHAEMLERIKAREAAEKSASEAVTASSEQRENK
ncbi:MAG: hypothetical protein ACN6NU_09030 [Acinetobacter sp.]